MDDDKTNAQDNRHGGNPSWWADGARWEKPKTRWERTLPFVPLAVGLAILASGFVWATVTLPLAILTFPFYLGFGLGIFYWLEGSNE